MTQTPWEPLNEDFETPEPDFSDWGVDDDYATPVTYIPAPDDSDHPWYDDYVDELAKYCPDPDCICKKEQDG